MTRSASTAASSRPAGSAGPGSATTSRAVIDLDALAHNARVLADAAGVPWMAVVKADAYGHGLGPVARTCLRAGASWLGVAQLAEALHLREMLDAAGVARPSPDDGPAPEHPRLLCWLAPVHAPQRAAAPPSPLRATLRGGGGTPPRARNSGPPGGGGGAPAGAPGSGYTDRIAQRRTPRERCVALP